MSKEKRRVPKLRFPGFTEDWEQCELEELCNIYDGTHQTPRYTNNGVMFVSVENIKTLESDKYISEDDFKSEFKISPEYGDILLTRIGDVGSANIILDNIKRAYYVSLALLKPKDISSLFLLALLASFSVQSEIWRRTLHIAFPKKINKNEIGKVIVNKPSIPEQKKIGELIYALDRTVTLHQRKLNNLKLKKKALFQKLFPKNGERYPELRFPGFTDAWEQRKLSEVTTCFDNLRVAVTASDRVPGKIPYYGANGIQDYVSGHTHSGEFVLIAEDGANDLNDYPIQYVNGAIWVNNHAHVIAGYKEKLENNFLSYSLKTVKMTTFIVGGGRSKLNLKALLEIPISMPNYDEQCVIGEFIETIDKNITLHQRKLDHLQLQKKALLQQMFV